VGRITARKIRMEGFRTFDEAAVNRDFVDLGEISLEPIQSAFGQASVAQA
jgi:hypothetical protein